MAYSELVKSFEKIRGYMREFYVYGFKSREEYDGKSSRSYDNERRRIESWLGDCMAFRQNAGGKTVFLTVDARGVPHNPLFRAFKAKSFTANDVTLHFYLLDLLRGDTQLTVRQIVDGLFSEYYSKIDDAEMPDESTIRKKLREYTELGLLESVRQGRENAYRRAQDAVELPAWREAVEFFSEVDPLGVVGSYLLDKLPRQPDVLSYKHHYLLYALDSEILYALLLAIREHRAIELTSFISRRSELRVVTVLPVKIYVSTQTGRQYLLAYHYRLRRPIFYRIDNIRSVKAGAVEKRLDKYGSFHAKLQENLWGVSLGAGFSLDHVEMTVRVGKGEGYILDRLEREKRCGRIEVAENGDYRFVADVYDAAEMLPWLRTFIGRITDFQCSDETVRKRFLDDLEAMRAMYGGERNAVQ